MSVWSISCVWAAQMASEDLLTCILLCIKIASDLLLYTAEFLHVLKKHSMASEPSPCFNWGLDFQINA